MPLDHYVTLGRSGLRVSPFALGAMTFGEDPPGAGASVEESEKILATYLDQGGNFIDTANFYTNGHSERILGDFFAVRPGRRQHVVLASKFFGNMFPGDPNGGGAGRGSITAQLDATLRLVRIGKIRYAGFSNTPGWVTARAQTLAELSGWTPLIALQVLSPEQLRRLDEVSAPVLNYPAPMHGAQRAMLQFAGTTVDGEASTVYPPLVASDVRY